MACGIFSLLRGGSHFALISGFIPGTEISQTTRLAHILSTGIYRLATLDRGDTDRGTALSAKLRARRETSLLIRVIRIAGRTTGVCSTRHRLTTLKAFAIGIASGTACVRLCSEGCIVKAVRRSGLSIGRDAHTGQFIKVQTSWAGSVCIPGNGTGLLSAAVGQGIANGTTRNAHLCKDGRVIAHARRRVKGIAGVTYRRHTRSDGTIRARVVTNYDLICGLNCFRA